MRHILTIAMVAFSILIPAFSSHAGTPEIIAGNGQAGFKDGHDAQFNNPIRLAPFGPGKILVADIGNHAIRVVSRNGNVTTIAGGPDRKGYKDGSASAAMFNSPHGVAVSPDGLIAVAGASSHLIRLLTPSDHGYQVSTLAGMPGKSGLRDGPAQLALFNSPHAIAWQSDGSLLVVDIGNGRIRRIRNGRVTTILGPDTAGMAMPIDISAAPDGSFLIADAGNNIILRWTGGDRVETVRSDHPLDVPHGVAGDAKGAVYVAEIGSHQISRLFKGHREVIAGTGIAGHAPGQLDKPAAVLVHDGVLWIADLNNHRISIVGLKQD